MGNITNPEYQKQFEADFSAEPPRKKRKTNPNSATQEDYAFTSSQTKSGVPVLLQKFPKQPAKNPDDCVAKRQYSYLFTKFTLQKRKESIFSNNLCCVFGF